MHSSWDNWGFLLFHTHFAVKVNAPFMTPSWAVMLHFGNKVRINYMVKYFVQLIILMKDLISLITLQGWFWAWVTVSATHCTATSKNGPHTESGITTSITIKLAQQMQLIVATFEEVIWIWPSGVPTGNTWDIAAFVPLTKLEYYREK